MKYLPLTSLRSFATFIFMISILIGCTNQKKNQENNSVQKEKEQKLEEFFIRLNEAAQAGDKSAYTGLFTSEASMFLPNRPPLIGNEAIGEWFEIYGNKVTQITDTYQQEEINIAGDIAIVRSRGTGNYVIKSTQEQFPLRNKFIDVLQYSNGEWLMIYHLASSFSLEPGLWNRDWENE